MQMKIRALIYNEIRVFLIAALVLGLMSRFPVEARTSVSVIAMPIGSLAALFLVFGVRVGPLLAVAGILLLTGHPERLAVTAFNFCGFLLFTIALRRYNNGERWLVAVPSTLTFLWSVFAFSIFACGVDALYTRHLYAPVPGDRDQDSVIFLLHGWSRMAAGLLTAMPVILVHFARPLRTLAGMKAGTPTPATTGGATPDWAGEPGPTPVPSRREGAAAIAEGILLGLAAPLIFWLALQFSVASSVNVLYLAGTPLLAAAVRRGMAAASIAGALFGTGSALIWYFLASPAQMSVLELRLLIIVSVIGALVLAAYSDERALSRRALRAGVIRFRELAKQNEAAREQERELVSGEIYARLNPSLAKLQRDLEVSAQSLASGEPVEPVLEDLAHFTTLVDGLVGAVRNIADRLRPGVLDTLGLSAAVEWFAGDFTRRTGVPCGIAQLDRVSAGKDCVTAVFRVFEETLTELRPSSAARVIVRLEQQDREVRLTVDVFADPPDAGSPERSRFNVPRMRERAEQAGGTLQLTSRQGGSRVSLLVPAVYDHALL